MGHKHQRSLFCYAENREGGEIKAPSHSKAVASVDFPPFFYVGDLGNREVIREAEIFSALKGHCALRQDGGGGGVCVCDCTPTVNHWKCETLHVNPHYQNHSSLAILFPIHLYLSMPSAGTSIPRFFMGK